METKRCSLCGVEKPKLEFATRRDRPIGVVAACRQCQRERYNGPRYHGNKAAGLCPCGRKRRPGRATCVACAAALAAYQKRRRKDPAFKARRCIGRNALTHGITPEEYTERRSRPCEICGVHKDEPGKRGSGMHIDHDHVTGALRGTLCDRCNRGLGMFDDDVKKLEAAVAYARKYGA